MLTGDDRSYDYALPEDGCIGFLAVGHRQVQHLGLTLFAPSGRLLAQDEGRDAHAYARFCGEGGRRFVVNVRMMDGQGEFQLVPLWNAPATLDALEPIMASCMSTGTARPDPVDVGPEPLGPPIDVELLSVTRNSSRSGIGWRAACFRVACPSGDVKCDGLCSKAANATRWRRSAMATWKTSTCACCRSRTTLSLVAADVTRRRDAVVKVCPERAGAYVLDVRMYRGAGSYVVQSFGLTEPRSPRPTGIDGNTRIPYAELLAQFEKRGMHAAPVSWGLLQPEGVQVDPTEVRAGPLLRGRRHRHADFAGGDLDMSLIDEPGRLFAADIGPNPQPLLYHCATRDGVLRAVLRGHDVRRPARFLVLFGDDSAPSMEASK